MTSVKSYPAFRPVPISNEVSSINKFVDLRKRTNDLKARYLPRYVHSNPTEYFGDGTWSNGPIPYAYVALSVKQSHFVAIYLELELKTGNAGINSTATGVVDLIRSDSGTYQRKTTSAAVGGDTFPGGSWIFFDVTPGIHTFYFVTNGSAANSFKNRKIYGMVL